MNTIRFASRDAFIEALESRRSFWVKYDQRAAREHATAERLYLDKARKKMREALKWDYATLSKKAGYHLTLGDVPRCPVLMERKIDDVLASLKLTQAKSFIVDSRGVWETAHHLLTNDPYAKRTVC